MVQRGERGDAPLEQGVDQPGVEVQPGPVHRAGAGRNDPGPRDGEPVGVQAELAHHRHVLGVAVIVVARLVCVRTVHDATGSVRERVPDGPAATVLAHRTFDLEGRCGRTPDETVGEAAGRDGRRRRAESGAGGGHPRSL